MIAMDTEWTQKDTGVPLITGWCLCCEYSHFYKAVVGEDIHLVCRELSLINRSFILPQARALKQYCHTRSQFPRT